MVENIAVCGLGKLGSCVAASLADAGFKVIGVDNNAETVLTVNKGFAPVDEPGLDNLYARYIVKATTDYAEAVKQSEACVFVLPTPSMQGGLFDNSYLILALDAMAKEVEKQNKEDYLFIISSTVNPGSCAKIFMPTLRKRISRRFGLAYKPEFIALGTVLDDLTHPDLILIGESDEKAGKATEDIYKKITNGWGTTRRMNFVDAELAKISLNCFVTMKISFANQLALAADKLEANADKILEAIGADERIGSKCLRPGLPYGGPCFPRDNRMFAAAVGWAPLAKATDDVNRNIVASILNRILVSSSVGYGKTVGILGLAYKPGTAITEESLGSLLAQQLMNHGFEVLTHDPKAKCSSELDEVLACRIIVVGCGWPEYSQLLISNDVCVIDPMHVLPKVRLCKGEAVHVGS